MDLGYIFGSTFRMRYTWINEVGRRVQAGQLPPAYQRTVRNLGAAYFLAGLLSRHWIRLRNTFSPVEMLIAITDWCPHQCRYCYNRSGKSGCKNTFINLDRLNVVLDEMKKTFGIRFAVITGGEPFPYVLKLARRRPDFTFFTYTSGHISQRTCQEMVELGNIIPALTIVDVDPAIHNYIRGEGSFQRIMTAREQLQAHQLPWGWSLTSSRINFQQLTEGGLLEKLAAYSPYFIRAMPWMPVGNSEANQVLSLAEMARVGQKIREAQQQGVIVFDYITAPVGYPCLAGGRRSFFLAPDGKDGLRASPCVFMEEHISVPISFNSDGSSTLLEMLRCDPWFKNARVLAGRHQCIIHENRNDWRQLVRGEDRRII